MSETDNTRRKLLKVMGLGAVSLANRGMVFAEEPTQKRPHVLVIHVDQHRLECLGAYGNREIKTPNIDSLAAGGVRYENSFCPYPVCTPSRYSLLSGLPVHEHRGSSNHCTLHPDIATFPRLLRANGYKTKAVGKMHFTPTYLDVGFDELELSEQDGPGRWDDDYHRYLMRRGLVDLNDIEDQRREYREKARAEYRPSFGALVSNLPDEHHSTTWIGNRAVETLETWDETKPQLLMAGFIKPHHPFDPPAPWHEMYRPEDLSLFPGWTDECLPRDYTYSKGYFDSATLTESALRRITAYYYATISQIDHHVGRMIDTLKKKNLYDNTLIVFTSDHGEYLGFHHLLLKGNYMYDPVTKVPLIVKYPGGGGAGAVSQALVNNTDLAPTILNVTGVEPAAGMNGLDLRRRTGGHEIVFSGQREVMARSQTRKLILSQRKQGENLFFNLTEDPLEMENLYGDPRYRQEIEEFTAAVQRWMPDSERKAERYLDYDAPQIQQPNVPPLDLSHRDAIIQFYHDKILG